MMTTARRGGQRDSYRGQPQEATLDGGRDCAGIQDVITQIGSVVHAGNHHVEFVVKVPGDREVDAISRRPRHIVDAGLGFKHAQRHVEGQRIAGATAVTIRRHDGDRHVGERGEGLPQAANTFCTETVVVADQYLHG